MELAQIIKWVDDTNRHLEGSTDNAREYNEDAGYILEYKQYIYAITEHFLKMDKNNKEAFTRRLFRNMDSFIFEMRNIKTDYLEGFTLSEKWEALPEGLKPVIADSIPLPKEWVECIDEIFDNNIITFHIGNALFADLLKVYCEVIRLCFESDINPEELAHPYHTDIINSLVAVLHSRRDEIQKQPEKYRTMPRTHRIEAVKLLLTHTGVARNIDRTQIAAFVEAVTGGNISVKPKDTASYKTHSKEAEKSAKELLQRIGIEIK